MNGISSTSLRLRLLVFGGTLLVSLVTFEIVCRLLDVDFNPSPNWRFHPTLGWTQERSMSYHATVDGDLVTIEFNSLGFRDVEHALAKPRSTRRLVVVGDSFSEAIQVNLEETYWHRLQHLLNENRPERWEVINLGVGDFGNAQAWQALTEFGLAYSPDLVLFQIFPLNDICNNEIELAGLCKSQNDLFRPYFVQTRDGPSLTHVDPVRHWLRSWFVTFGVLEKAYMTFRQRSQPQDVDELHRQRYVQAGFPNDPLLYTFVETNRQPGPIAHGWHTTEQILEQVEAVSKRNSLPWIAVVMPFEARVGPRWSEFASNFPDLPMDQGYPEKRLGRFFEQLGVPSVMLRETFEQHLDVFFPSRDGHLNPAAHKLAAQTIYDKLVSEKLLDDRH